MNPLESKSKVGPKRHRFLLHLSGMREESCEECRYTASIRLWAARGKGGSGGCVRTFKDEDDMVRTVNPLLAHGSDVRDVLGHIESPDGFFYLLYLSVDEACKFGWRR